MPKSKRAPRELNQDPVSFRWARKKSGLTQTALAARSGVSRTLIVEIEAGTRNATDENLIKLAEAMNCPVVVLERKREPQTTPAADVDVPTPMRNAERAEPRDVPEVHSASPVERSA